MGGGGGGGNLVSRATLSQWPCVRLVPFHSYVSSPMKISVRFGASAGGRLRSIRMWWDKLVQHGPTYGYLPNASKSWLIVKDAKHSEAHAVFQGSGVPITSKGKHYLGDAIGSESFVHSYVSEKVSEWITEYELLSQISLTQPHSAYAAFTRGVIFPKQYPIFNHYCNLWMMPSASHFFLVSRSKHIQLPTQRFVSPSCPTWSS